MCICWNILLCQTNDREDKDIMKSETPSGKTYSKKVQHLLFPKPEICSEEQMYFRRSGRADYFFAMDNITVHNGGRIDFNTYFNSFSIGKWSKYTFTEKVNLTVEFSGKFLLTLCREDRVIESTVKTVLHEQIISSEKRSALTVPFDCTITGGIFYFCLAALEDNSKIYGGYYSIECGTPIRNDVKLGIAICHFKKEKYISHNMQVLDTYLKNNTEFKNKAEVFISDNGQTLTQSDAPYPFVHIFKNKNLGGAGGFGRCMYEIQQANKKGSGITHILLMDDDLTFDPEIIFRTYSFISALKPEYNGYFISGSMCRSDYKHIQHENGALWNDGNIISLKRLDLNDFTACLFNDCYEETPDFAAWWFCAIPVEVTENNFPMPIFYREDDVEYSLRNAKGIISMNGICVWHEPFENKFVPFVCYYHMRNAHITNAIHADNRGRSLAAGGKKRSGKKILLASTLNEITREVSCLRYKIADLYLNAAFDFLKGIDWLKNTDTVEQHKKVTASGYKLIDADKITEMPFMYGYYLDSINKPPYRGLKKFIWEHSDNGYLIKATKDVWVPIAIEKVRPEMFARAKRAYHYDQCSHRGFITERSKKEYKRIMSRYKQLVRLANRTYKKVAEEYRKRQKEIFCEEFWKKYLGV